ncbi:MAG: reverse transcriptase family protein [Psychroserpens sp.]|nr:reverse transcriptase family protein [Psychroserpens sp.]
MFGGDKMNQAIWQLCKVMFDNENVSDDWLDGIIFPIYKDDDRRDPLNYRGITLLSVVSKVYTSILNQRLSEWCERKKILVEEQGGFRPGRGCVDQIFVLSSIIRKRKSKQTCCCFIDLKKAFDRVWRKGLWKALWEEGI